MVNQSWAKSILLGAVSSIAIGFLGAPALAQNDTEKYISLKAQTLGDALTELSNAYGVSISVDDNLIRGAAAPAIAGTYSAQSALTYLLRGTGLVSQTTSGGSLIIIEEKTSAAIMQRSKTPKDTTETIIVTGSRIERSALDAPNPISIITSDEIERFGFNDATEALRFTPALNQSRSVLSSSDVFADNVIAGGLGVAGLDLRGLGTSRTLVLVDGRRHVAGIAGEATVDVSSIPSALIDRVEVLTGGGSSIYGADAVSGVVNYVLKDDFEGVEYRGSFNISDQGDAESYFGSLTVGGNFAGGRGNAWLNVEASRQTALEDEDRNFFDTATDNILLTDAGRDFFGLPDEAVFAFAPLRFAFFTPFGRFNLEGVNTFASLAQLEAGQTVQNGIPIQQVIDETGTLRPFNLGFPTFAGGFGGVGGDGSENDFSLIPETNRVVLNGRVDYDISTSATVFIEGKYSLNDTSARTLDGAPGFVDLSVALDNAFIPAAVQTQIDNLVDLGVTPQILLSKAFEDEILEPRTQAERQTFRVVSGVTGSISEDFSYEVSVNYGRTSTEILERNEVFLDRFLAATDAVVDPDTGNIVCRSDIDPNAAFPTNAFLPPAIPGFATFAPGDGQCSPINVFGPNSLTQENVDFISTNTVQNFTIEQFVINATVTGSSASFFELPAGPIQYAAGFEYRREDSAFVPDNAAVTQTVITALGSSGTEVRGNFDVIEGFGEVKIPLVKNAPFAKELSVDASLRLADYSTAGSTTSFAFGGVWSPAGDLRIRGSFNRAVRAPNISELFTPQVTTFSPIAFSQDPCDIDEIASSTSPNRASNCALFVPDTSSFDPGITPVFITTGGNPGLREETADTFTIGFAYKPSFLDGFSIIADYYSIDIEGAIGGGLDVRDVASLCVDAPSTDNLFCDAVVRDPNTGLVQSIETTLFNLSSLKSEGIDYEINYAFNLDSLFKGSVGDFRASIAGTYLINREDFPLESDPNASIDLTRTFLFPKTFLRFGLGWNKGKWSADYNFTYRSSTRPPAFSNESFEGNPVFIVPAQTGDAFVHNVGVQFEPTDTLAVFFRVNDLADRGSFQFATTTSVPSTEIGRQFQFGIQGSF